MLRRIDPMKVLAVFTCMAMLAMVGIIWLYPIAVSAQNGGEVPDTNAAQEVTLLIVKVVFSLLNLFGLWLVGKAISYFEKKTTIDIPAQTEALLHEWADKGIGLAFEKAHQAADKGAAKLTGPQKLEIAMKFVVGMAKEYKLPELAEDKLKDYIEGKLGLKRKDETNSLPDAEAAAIVAAEAVPA